MPQSPATLRRWVVVALGAVGIALAYTRSVHHSLSSDELTVFGGVFASTAVLVYLGRRNA